MENVILVDPQDEEVGTLEKLEAHRSGVLHRAVSVVVFNKKQEWLIQKRAVSKYHSGGLWSNTCCGHPRPGESVELAGKRRLWEELGIQCPLKKVLEFTYQATLDQGLIEHEYDHVLMGTFEGSCWPNPEEVCDWKWIGLEALQEEMKQAPDQFTYWFKQLLPKVISYV